jgi:hypothetical protein
LIQTVIAWAIQNQRAAFTLLGRCGHGGAQRARHSSEIIGRCQTALVCSLQALRHIDCADFRAHRVCTRLE